MITKKHLAEAVKTATGLSLEKSLVAVNTVINEIVGGLKEDGEARIDGFGTLKVTDKPERQGRNPKTGEVITIHAHKSVVYKAAKVVKEAVNK